MNSEKYAFIRHSFHFLRFAKTNPEIGYFSISHLSGE